MSDHADAVTGSVKRLRFRAPESVAVEAVDRPSVAADEVGVRTCASAISPGTERLIYRGEAPAELPADETFESIEGSLSFPLCYGYAAVGRVDRVGEHVDESWLGRRVFGFHPHASYFTAAPENLHVIPDEITDEDAAFLPFVETAVNFLLDGAPALGERVGVFGQGLVGLLTTALLAAHPLGDLVTVDRYESRRELSEALGADESLPPDDSAIDRLRCGDPAGRDLTYELSGNPEALDDAIDATGYDGTVLVGSWYGTTTAELDLGGRFHRQRIAIESSQVSTLSPPLRGRWSIDRRLAVAWDWLDRLPIGQLRTHQIPFDDAPEAYRLLEEDPDEAIGVLLTYS